MSIPQCTQTFAISWLQEGTISSLRQRSGRKYLHPIPVNSDRRVRAYDYYDESGDLLFQVVRYERRGLAQRRPEGRGMDVEHGLGEKVSPA